MGRVDPREREELKVVRLVEPGTFEHLDRKPRPAGERQRIYRQLHVGVFLLSCVGLVVEDMDVAVADLQKINVARDHVCINGERKPRLR